MTEKIYLKIMNSSGRHGLKNTYHGWTENDLDEWCRKEGLVWEDIGGQRAHIHGPCGRDCHCHPDGAVLRPFDSDGNGNLFP